MKKVLNQTGRSLSIIAIAAFATMAWGADNGSTSTQTGTAGKPSASSLLLLDDGRSGRGNLIATTGIRGFSKPANSSAHALIMAIGEYQGNIPKLKGVPFDTATAVAIAQRMGVPAANITALKDDQLTLTGMRKALDDLESSLGGDDQVFIYYSGHGGRQLVQEDNGERCAESLITVDGQPLVDSELEQRLKRIAAKSQKTIVFLDACHSGGVTTRALAMGQRPFAPKSYSAGESCVKPSNMLTRSLGASRPPGFGGANFVHIAAAKDSEVSLDQPGRGGVASQAWLACMAGAARDKDGSGGLSAEEIQSCAQDQIDAKLRNVQGFTSHHVTLIGNSDMVLSYAPRDNPPPVAASTPPAAPAPTSPAPTPAPVTAVAPTPAPAVQQQAPAPTPVAAVPAAPAAPAPAATAPVPPSKPAQTAAAVPVPAQTPAAPAPAAISAPPAPPVKPSAIAALKDIYNSRDDRRLVTLTAPKSTLKIGKDAIDFTLTSREGGYVYLLMVGSDGQTFDLLFPNQLDPDNRIEAGGTIRLPRPAWELRVEGPVGRDTLLAIVTDNPRDFSAAGLQPSGPFSSVVSAAAKDIQLVTAQSTASRDADTGCARPAATRNLAIAKRCSNGYAAALLTLDEVR